MSSVRDTAYWDTVAIPSAFLHQDKAYLWMLKPTFMNQGNGIHVFNDLLEMEVLMNKYIAGYTSTPKTTQEFPKKGFRIR